MYTKSEMAAKREGATYDADPATTLYTVSCVAFLLGVGRNQMKKFNIPKAKIHGTGKDWIRKCDLQSWLSRIEADPDSEQWKMLCQRKEEYFQKLVQRVLPDARRLAAPKKMSDPLGDAWKQFKETGRLMDDSDGPKPSKPKGMSNNTYRFWLDVIADRPTLNPFFLESALRDAYKLF